METTAAQEAVNNPEDAIAFAVHNELTKNALVAKTTVPGRKKPVARPAMLLTESAKAELRIAKGFLDPKL
jgi:hypothetical protein